MDAEELPGPESELTLKARKMRVCDHACMLIAPECVSASVCENGRVRAGAHPWVCACGWVVHAGGQRLLNMTCCFVPCEKKYKLKNLVF